MPRPYNIKYWIALYIRFWISQNSVVLFYRIMSLEGDVNMVWKDEKRKLSCRMQQSKTFLLHFSFASDSYSINPDCIYIFFIIYKVFNIYRWMGGAQNLQWRVKFSFWITNDSVWMSYKWVQKFALLPWVWKSEIHIY